MTKPQLLTLPIEALQRGRFQPRQDFDQVGLQELAQSIESSGLIQPIVVRPIDSQYYEIVAGERRWRAAQLAELAEVPCLVNHYDNEQAAAVATIENIQRKNLNPIEEASAYKRMQEEFGYLHEEIAIIVGKSRPKISNMLRLLELDANVQQWLISGQLSTGHGKVLAGLPQQLQRSMAEQCVNEQWAVRTLEQAVKKYSRSGHAIQGGPSPDVGRLEQIVSEQFGAEVKLDSMANSQSGWLKIRYYDNDTLAGLLDKIGVDYEKID